MYAAAFTIRAFHRVDQRVAGDGVGEVRVEALTLSETPVRLGDVEGRSARHTLGHQRETARCRQRLQRILAARTDDFRWTLIERAGGDDQGAFGAEDLQARGARV